MNKSRFEKIFYVEQIIHRPLNEVFELFSKAENLQRITPPQLHFHILTKLPIEMHAGARIDYKIKIHGLPMTWKTLIETWDPPNRFVDNQLSGPYKLWHHTHEFKSLGPSETLMTDTVRYEVPLGWLGLAVEVLLVRNEIEKIFAFRRAEVERIFAR